IADRAHHAAAVARDAGEFGERRHAAPVAVGYLLPPVGAEGLVEKHLDGREVGRLLLGELDHRWKTRAGEREEGGHRCLPCPSRDGSSRAESGTPRRARSWRWVVV